MTMTDTTFRKRCASFISNQQRRAIMRVGDPVQELMEFVIAETGKHAAPELDETLPLCLYFEHETGRDEFISMVQQMMPTLQARKVQ